MLKWFFIKFYNLNYKIKKNVSAAYYSFRNRWHLSAAGVDFSDDLRINGKILVTNLGKISIGRNVVMNSESVPNPVGTALMRLYAENGNSQIIIEDNVGLSSSLVYASKSVVIKEGTLVGADSIIADSDFHDIKIDETTGKRGKGSSSEIVIEENVFIGTRSVILKGVHIGKGSVVGAGSVVTRDIPAGEIWAGNPAKFIRRIES